jgi:hypothetical protein
LFVRNMTKLLSLGTYPAVRFRKILGAALTFGISLYSGTPSNYLSLREGRRENPGGNKKPRECEAFLMKRWNQYKS